MYKFLKNLIPGIFIFVLLMGFTKSSVYADDCTVPTDPLLAPVCAAFSGPPVVDENRTSAQNTLIKFVVKYNNSPDFSNVSKIVLGDEINSALSCSNNHVRISNITNGAEISTYCDFSGYAGQTINVKVIYCPNRVCHPQNSRVLVATDYTPVNEGDLGERLVMNALPSRCNANGDWVQRFTIIDTQFGATRNQSLLLFQNDINSIDLIADGACFNVTLGRPITKRVPDLLGEIECKIPSINLSSPSTKYEIRLYAHELLTDKIAFESARLNITASAGYAKLNSANQLAGKREVGYKYDIREAAGASYIFDIVDNTDKFLQNCGSKTGNSCETNVGGSCITNNLIPNHDYFLVMKRNVNPSTYPNYVEVNRVSFRYESPDPGTDDTCSCIANNCTNATIPQATNKCLLGKTATVDLCVPASSGNPSCTCKCQGTATPIDDAVVPDDKPGYVRPAEYNLETFKGFIGWIHNLLIAVGVVAAVFIFPYSLVLMASGSPENINKGKEWLYSLLVGLGVLILSGTIIRLFGNVLSL